MKNDKDFYSSKEVAKRLSIQPVTVRKYSQMLEDLGFPFEKDEKNWRRYSEDDIKYLEHVCNMKSMGKSLDESISHVATLYHANLSIAPPAIPLQEKDILLEYIKAQHEVNQNLMQRLEEQEKRQIERDQDLLAAIKEIQDTQRLSSPKQKKWWELWK